MKVIDDKTHKVSLYRDQINPEMIEKIFDAIVTELFIKKKYHDPEYSAKQLASDIGVSLRYISAVINNRFQDNYSQLVNTLRINEAMYMLQDTHFRHYTLEDVSLKVGFATRQSFHSAFMQRNGMTPKQYRTIKRDVIESSRERRNEVRRSQDKTRRNDNAE